jgi:hypothetical protein
MNLLIYADGEALFLAFVVVSLVALAFVVKACRKGGVRDD